MGSRDQSSDRPRGVAAVTEGAAVETAVDEAMPVEFPIDFDEWSAGVPAVWRVALAGFRHTVRQADQLRAVRPRADWQADFTKFLDAPAQ